MFRPVMLSLLIALAGCECHVQVASKASGTERTLCCPNDPATCVAIAPGKCSSLWCERGSAEPSLVLCAGPDAGVERTLP